MKTGVKWKPSRLSKMKRRTQPTQRLRNDNKKPSRISKRESKQVIHNRIKDLYNNKCQRCQCQKAWQCQCQRTQLDLPNNLIWVNSSRKAFLLNSTCQCLLVKWVKFKCPWCLVCKECQCQQCPNKQFLVNSRSIVPNFTKPRINHNRRKKLLYQKAGAM